MHFTVSDRRENGNLFGAVVRLSVSLGAHRQGCQHLIVDGETLRRLVVLHLVVGAFEHLVLVHLLHTVEAERVATRKRNRLFIVVVVRLKANAAFEDAVDLLCDADGFVVHVWFHCL